MKFQLFEKEAEEIAEWESKHGCPIEYEGAIGGKTTYSFTPNSIGMVTKAICACGAEVDVTDYDLW